MSEKWLKSVSKDTVSKDTTWFKSVELFLTFKASYFKWLLHHTQLIAANANAVVPVAVIVKKD